MSKASDLIERAERESGARFDDPDNPNAMNILLGALAREMGKSSHDARDDMAAGIIIRDLIENGEAKRRADNALISLMLMGLPPDALR